MFARAASRLIPGVPNQSKSLFTKTGNIFELKLTGGGQDERILTPALLKSFRSEVCRVKSDAKNGCVLITTAEGNSFCSGFRCEADGYSKEMVDSLKELVKDLISLEMPTIAAINGCAKGAGLILAMSHDYLTMKSDTGLLRLTELDNKMTLPDYFTTMIRSKMTPRGAAILALSGSTFGSFNSEQAKEMGLVVERPYKNKKETPLCTAKELAKGLSLNGWDGKVYAEIRKSLYPDLCNALGPSCAQV